MTDRELTIVPKFAKALRPLTVEERSLLEASIEQYGCLEPIVTWANHDDAIVDGHHRYEICCDLGCKFTTKALVFEDESAVIEFIKDKNRGRRNLDSIELSILRGERHESEKRPARRPTADEKGEDTSPLKTSERLGGEYGVTDRTILSDAALYRAVKGIAGAVGKPIAQVVAGPLKDIPQAQIKELDRKFKAGELDDAEVKEALAGGKEAIKEAIKPREIKRSPGELREELFHSYVHRLNAVLGVDHDINEDFGGLAKLIRSTHWPRGRTGLFLELILGYRTTLDGWIAILQKEIRK